MSTTTINPQVIRSEPTSLLRYRQTPSGQVLEQAHAVSRPGTHPELEWRPVPVVGG